MFPALTIPQMTGVFLGVVVSLGTAFVYAIWQLEQAAQSRLARALIEKARRRNGRF